MKSFTVTRQDDGQRLNRFLENVVPSLYPSMMYKYLRIKRIKVNNKKAEGSTRLSEGDVVELYISDDFFTGTKSSPDFMKASSKLTFIYQDDNIALIYKPAGILTHDDKSENRDTLINRFLRYLYEHNEYESNTGESFTPALCNRLDRGTSGIVIAAKNSSSLREMNKIIKLRMIKKHYLAIVTSKPPADGIYSAYLIKDEKNNTVSVMQRAVIGAKSIITGLRTISKNNGLYLVEVDLITGRTHQIRAHLRFLGCPILGDGKYGDGRVNRKFGLTRQALACYKVTFELDAEENDFPVLFYLNNRSFEIKSNWFVDEYF